jgi:hypothetical protein
VADLRACGGGEGSRFRGARQHLVERGFGIACTGLDFGIELNLDIPFSQFRLYGFIPLMG